ncbi:hypothetical protein D5086_022618 [Populus alba]|uniref:Uncharacterized protein n=1 Tax=Populus alba TaxID=43335 RepID=A0ACC4BFM6_POPAL
MVREDKRVRGGGGWRKRVIRIVGVWASLKTDVRVRVVGIRVGADEVVGVEVRVVEVEVEVEVVLLAGLRAEVDEGVEMVLVGDGAAVRGNVGLRVMLVLVLVVGVVVVEELGECVGLRVQMKVEVALVARRRKEEKYLSIEREFLDFLEFGFVQSRDVCGLVG